jgi:hypothetical protein
MSFAACIFVRKKNSNDSGKPFYCIIVSLITIKRGINEEELIMA